MSWYVIFPCGLKITHCHEANIVHDVMPRDIEIRHPSPLRMIPQQPMRYVTEM